MKAKMILIQEIRAMESKPAIRHKLVDLTQTAGYGLLGEMSIAEVLFLLFYQKFPYAFPTICGTVFIQLQRHT